MIFLFEKLGLHPDKKPTLINDRSGFDFANTRDTTLKFELPNLNGDDLTQALDLLDVKHAEYKSKEHTVVLKEAIVFDTLFPKIL